ncbi:MAG: valine--tRNA ligase [Clostridia bacterium]
MNKTYNPSDFEKEIYKSWLDKNYFSSKPQKGKKRFSISMPPPNITGKLHVGHALNNAFQDALVRFKRMKAFETLWVPGTDHAAIATEAKICEALSKEGLTKEKIGREAFMKRTEEWYKLYGGTIQTQLETIGTSCDWNRMSFTMDEKLSKAVRHVFVTYYNEGLIYKGKRVVNWCPKCKSAISDTENIHIDQDTSIWHIKYPFVDGSGFLTVATTRPETLFGDTAVAVNPNDKKYEGKVGKMLYLPLTNRQIPIIADEYCEIGFGSGAVKITPAHDPNDYEIGLRHNLEIISCIGDDGVLNENAGEFANLDRFEARKKVVEKLKSLGLIEKIEKYKNKVGTCDRCKTIIEPKISTQWFVAMEKLAKPAIDALKNGELKIFPKRFDKHYLNWLENIQDWCISRQLWLGHRLPVFYCDDCGEIVVSETDISVCPKCGSKKITQESDVLDTWFSSALWPFSTLGYPDKSEDLDYYYPNNVLVTAYDILTFWVTKMVYSGIHFMGKVPFDHCVIHGLVRDLNGKKMSKSLGNGIDPIEVVKEFGADALRISLLSGMTVGGDVKYGKEKAEKAKNFLNKLWNASKFVLAYCTEKPQIDLKKAKLSLGEEWILNELNNVVKETNKKFDKYELGTAIISISDFVWGKFCDWFIELSKTDLNGTNEERKLTTKAVLVYVLENILKLLHPFAPFTTEEIFISMPWHSGESLMVQPFPEYDKNLKFSKAKNFDSIISIIKSIRVFRSEMKIPDNKRTKLFILPLNSFELISSMTVGINKLAMGINTVVINSEANLTDKNTKIVCESALIFIPNNDLFEEKKEIERLKKELENINFEIERSTKLLNNEGFVKRAPQSLIEAEKTKIVVNTQKKCEIEKALSSF